MRWWTSGPGGLRVPVGARQWVTTFDIDVAASIPATFALTFGDAAQLTVPAGHVAVVTHVHVSAAEVTDAGQGGWDASLRWALFAGERLWIGDAPVSRMYGSGPTLARDVHAFVWNAPLPLVVVPVLEESQRGEVRVTGALSTGLLGFATGWLAPVSSDLARELGVD